MSVYDQYNSLFHRCVNDDNLPRNTVEVYNSPFPTLLYDKDTPENPLFGMDIPKSNVITFGTYTQIIDGVTTRTPIQWRILGYDSENTGVVLLSEYILFKHEFDSSNIIWENSSLRSVLNTGENSFYNTSFSLEEKKFIKRVLTDIGVYDKVFLLSAYTSDNFCYLNYPGLDSKNKRKGTYNNVAWPWWLRSRGVSYPYIYEIDILGQAWGSSVPYNSSSMGVRPVIVVDIEAVSKNHSILNPFYCSSIWGKNVFFSPTTSKEENYYMFTVSDPISVHNQKYQGLNRKIYENVRNDFALFTKQDSDIEFNFVFKNVKNKISSMDELPEGIYITPTCVIIKEKEVLYQSGFVNTDSTIDQLFFSKFEKMNIDSFPSNAIYTSCWEDLDPRLELYLPNYGKKGNIYWLGKKIILDTEILNILGTLSRGYQNNLYV